MKKRNEVRRCQPWKNKQTGSIVTTRNKATGNRHWRLDNGHSIHEGTLLKFYSPLKK